MSRTMTEPRTRVDYLQRVRALAPVFASAVETEEERRELAPAVVAAMHEAGLFRMLLPRWLDGGELDILSYLRVVEEVAKHDASAAWCINQGTGCSMVSGYLNQTAAREIFGPPNGVVAWGPHPGARARAVDGGYVVNYSGQFASGSRHATWLGAHCLIDEADGTPRRNARGQAELRTLLFPKSQADVKDVWHVIGLRGTGSDSFVLRDLFVPASHTVLRDLESEQIDPSPVYRFPSNMVYSSGFACVALGIARTVLDAFLDIAQDKSPRGLNRTLREGAVVQTEVAVCEGEAARGARLSAQHGRRDRGGAEGADAPNARPADRHAAGGHLHDPPSQGRRRHDLRRRRRHRGIREQPVRAPLPRHPYRLPAGPGPQGAFRGCR